MATANTSGAINRITKEIANLQKGADVSLAVAFEDQDVRKCKALIIGPPETPYEYGFFEFDVKFTKDYPIKSPNVRAITTNGGKTRFNPNIYADGTVCLSILGTWRGNSGEEWSSAQGLESVLLSIQSLMSSNPFENEPGYEEAKKDEEEPKQYIAKIRHETIRSTVIQRLEKYLGIESPVNDTVEPRRRPQVVNAGMTPTSFDAYSGYASDYSASSNENSSPQEYDAEATYNALDDRQWDPFVDLLKRRFLWYYDTYKKNIEEFSKEQKDGVKFRLMPFEYGPNEMAGKFDYKGLLSRLKRVLKALNEEMESWSAKGIEHVRQNTGPAAQFAFQFGQLKSRWNESRYAGPMMTVSLVDGENPFEWKLSIFGRNHDNLEDGIWFLTLYIPPDFPATQPRVRVDTPIFHRQVNSIGNLAYLPEKPDEIGSHLEAIHAVFKDENPFYDPRAVVNPEAFALYWGGDDRRKIYNRKLRRSAQASRDFLYKMARDNEARAWNEPPLMMTNAEIDRARRIHNSPPAPFDFMFDVRPSADGSGGEENVVLDREGALAYYDERFAPILEQIENELERMTFEELAGDEVGEDDDYRGHGGSALSDID